MKKHSSDNVRHEKKPNGEPQKAPALDWVPPVRLDGKVILAFGGLGNLAETFLYGAALCGARIVIADLCPADPEGQRRFEEKARRITESIAPIGGHGPPDVLEADVTSVEQVDAAFRRVRGACGGVDIALNFAGVSHMPFDFAQGDPTEMMKSFRAVTDINLNGAFAVTMTAARAMIPRRSGHIIHLCSSGSRLSLYGVYGYNASKHGVEGLVKTAAAQLAPFGIRVNGIAPGTVITDLNRRLIYNPDGSLGARGLAILVHTPSKRFITREGVAETLLAMCVEQRHFTGNVVFADDGYNVEGHSWPEGNEALFGGRERLEALFRDLEERYPRDPGTGPS